MNRLKERDPNRPLTRATYNLVLEDKKNKRLNNQLMEGNSKIANHPVQPPPLRQFRNATNLPLLPIDEKELVYGSEEQTKVPDETQDTQLFERELPIVRKNNEEIIPYIPQIKIYALEREKRYAIDPTYLRNHKMLTSKMRSYLVRHLFKLCSKFELLRTTLHLAVHYMDLYFQRKSVFKDQLETVAIAQSCLFIAMKYQEIYPPELAEWVDRRYKVDIIRLEAEIMKTLDFQLAHYTLQNFLQFNLFQRGISESQFNANQSNKVLLIADLTLFDLNIKQYKYSQLSECLFQLLHIGNEEGLDRKIVLNIKWMIQRNQDTMRWLIDQKYRKIVTTQFF